MSNPKPIAQRGFDAAKWNYFGNAARMLFQFLIGIVLARLLGPETFGTVAIAWLLIAIGMLVADFGFGNALIQRDRIDERDVNFVFTLQLAIGVALSATGALAAGPVAAFFNNPGSEDVVRLMSLLFLIRAAGQTSTALLSRHLDYKKIQITNLFTYLIGFAGVGLPAAFLGYGVWSLVWAQLVQAGLYTAFLMLASRHRFRLRTRPHSPGLFRFGGLVIAAHLGSWVVLNFDSLVIGRNLGAVPLGLYNRAMTLVASPTGAATSSLQVVLFAACSRSQDNIRQVKKAYLSSTAALALACAPALMIAAAVPETVILGVYGTEWRAAVPILTPLALAMIVHAILALIGPVLMALDQTKREVYAQYGTAAFMVPVAYAASNVSLAAVAWSVVLIYMLRFVLLFQGLMTVIGVRPLEIVRVLKYPFLIGFISAAIAYFIDSAATTLPAIPRLVVVGACSGLAAAALMAFWRRRVFADELGDLLRGRNRLPQFMQRWVQL